MSIFDGHSDLLTDVAARRLKGERHVLTRCHFGALRRGDIEGLVLAVWADPRKGACGGQTMDLLAAAQAEFTECGWLSAVKTAAEARTARAKGQIYAFLAVEGMRAIGPDLRGIDAYAALGVRIGSLTWNGENQLAVGAGGDSYSGLTALGRQAVRRMAERGILMDVSHLNDGGFADVVKMARGPVIASHSNCRALCDVKRNLTDDQLRAVRDTGGIVGVNTWPAFVHTDPARQTVETLARHAARMADVMGVEHVACGFDFCSYLGPGNEGLRGMKSAAQARELFDLLEKMGMNRQERALVARENLLRVLA